MGKFLFVYYDTWPTTPEEQKKAMDAWKEWFEKLGDVFTDMGAPTIRGKIVSNSGIEDIEVNPLQGYSVVTASNLDAAVGMAEICPGIPFGGQVAVYELAEM
jgi:hypothetical protein